MKFEQNRCYRLAMEIVGDEMRVSLDDQPVGYLKSSGIAHPIKSDFHFTASGNATRFALFDSSAALQTSARHRRFLQRAGVGGQRGGR
jgi:hypothetical protein